MIYILFLIILNIFLYFQIEVVNFLIKFFNLKPTSVIFMWTHFRSKFLALFFKQFLLFQHIFIFYVVLQSVCYVFVHLKHPLALDLVFQMIGNFFMNHLSTTYTNQAKRKSIFEIFDFLRPHFYEPFNTFLRQILGTIILTGNGHYPIFRKFDSCKFIKFFR